MRDITKSEEKTLRSWKRMKTFLKSVSNREGKPRFVFYDGPPTANGRPGIHHVMILSMKDAFLRYKTMRGFLVERRAGWDTHGLPVELEVERELGFSGKADIEEYGIAKFNEKARKSVWTYKKEWEKLQDRIGFWVRHDTPYITYENNYIESVWWALKTANDKGLLEEDYKVVPYCPRCGTSLASHEIAQGYQQVHDRSLTVKFHVHGEKKVALLAWTTTPWTLPGNVALAVGKNITYAEVYVPETDDTYIVAKEAVGRVFGETKVEIKGELLGEKLVGLTYDPLFSMKETKSNTSHRVYAADFVNTEDGTGIVHTAVMYGEDDYRLGEEVGLPKVHTVSESGLFNEFVPEGLAGKFVKADETEEAIIESLKTRDLFFSEERYKHEYPFCWRCKTPLLYYARDSWFIRMSKLRNELIRENQAINWVPNHLKDGRFGEWLNEVKDWAISRERYWGTPLPVWRCEKDKTHIDVIGGVDELVRRKGFRNKYLVVRHGESESNISNLLSSDPKQENPLTDKGRKQAEDAAKGLKSRGVDLIITSDLMRAHQTASILASAVAGEPEVDERLREINFGEYHGKPLKEYQARFEKSAEIAFTKRPKGGEHWGDVRKRMISLMEDLEKKYEGKTIVLVSHSGPLIILEMAVRGMPNTAYFSGVIGELDNATTKELQGAILPHDKDGVMDLHRPYIDEVTLKCDKCGGIMHRTPEVCDVWLDSAAMPFAQWHYPMENRDLIDGPDGKGGVWYPADFILEAIDQTRGWFYTLLATSTFLGWQRPFRNVVSTGLVLDKRGKKMSKSKGNTVSPWDMIENYGADAIRWYFYTVNQPSDPKRFDEKDVKTALNRFLGTLSNAHTFFNTYGVGNAHKVFGGNIPETSTELDKWVLSRLHTMIAATQEKMDAYDLTGAARALEEFVIDDLSNWYVRRSRSRFQRPISTDDHELVSNLLAYVLVEVAKIAAPFTPFLADEIFTSITKEESVHVTDYPEPSAPLMNMDLEERMKILRAIVADGLAIRKAEKVPVRQPLHAIAVSAQIAQEDGFRELIEAELNIKNIEMLSEERHESWARLEGSLGHVRLDLTLTPELKIEGQIRELTRAVQEMRKEAKLMPQDKIILCVDGKGEAFSEFVRFVTDEPDVLRVETLQQGPKSDKEVYSIEREPDIEDDKIWLGIKK